MVLSIGMLRGSGELTHREGVSPQLWPKDEASVNEVCTLLNLCSSISEMLYLHLRGPVRYLLFCICIFLACS